MKKWIEKEGKLSREFTFNDFDEAFEFMTIVASIAKELNHHPDWCNSYNKVSIKLFTHDKNSLTEKDLELARRIDKIQ